MLLIPELAEIPEQKESRPTSAGNWKPTAVLLHKKKK